MSENTLDLGDDDGFITVSMAGASARLDLWETNNQLYDLHTRLKSRPDNEYAAAVVELMASLGLPACSHRVAIRFADGIFGLVAAAKKNDSGTAGSPASTESTPAP